MLGYIDYLKNFPCNMVAYSPQFILLAESGYFHATPFDQTEQVINYLDSVRKQNEECRECLERPPKSIKLSHPDKTFCQIKNYLEMSGAINEKQLVRWPSKKQPDKDIRTHVCVQLFRWKDFGQLVERALAANRRETSGETWKECLECHTPQKNTMSIKDSITVIRKWHNHNNLKIETDGLEPLSVTAMVDSILSKRITKKNTIIFHGKSNMGKSIIMNSAFGVFADIAHIHQGIANNFMFETLEDAEVCLWEEALFSPEHQETIKLVMEEPRPVWEQSTGKM